MLPEEGYSYRSKEGGGVAKVSKFSKADKDVTYILDGDLRTCTLGEFHKMFNLLSKFKPE